MAKKSGPDRGRKECSHEVRTKLRTHKVEIRFDRHSGEFFTQFSGEEFTDPSIRGLEGLLLKKAESLDHIEWKRWIAYSLLEHTDGYVNSYRYYQDGKQSFVGIEIDCVDLSVPQRGVARRYRYRVVDDDGTVQPILDKQKMGHIWDQERKLVEFTPERWSTLRKVQETILDARRKLGELLDGDGSDDVACRIDSMSSTLLAIGDGHE